MIIFGNYSIPEPQSAARIFLAPQFAEISAPFKKGVVGLQRRGGKKGFRGQFRYFLTAGVGIRNFSNKAKIGMQNALALTARNFLFPMVRKKIQEFEFFS
jgi:hypothetical protein